MARCTHALLLAVALGATGCARPITPEERDALLQRGDEALLAGRIVEAEDVFRQAVDGAGGARAQAGLGLALLRGGKTAEALHAFETALDLEPGNADTGFLRAVALADLGRGDEAIPALESILAGHPGRADVARRLIDLLAGAGRLDEARRRSLEAVDRSPNDFDLVIAAARLLAQSGATDAALAYHERARQIRPWSLEALYSLIEATRAAGRIEESLALIDLYRQLEATTKEVEALRAEAAADPGDPSAAQRYIERLFAEGWPDRAVSEALLYLEQFPHDAARGGAIAAAAARAALRGGDPALAARLYDRVKGLLAQSSDSAADLAPLALILGDIGEASRLYREAIERDPDNHDLLIGLGRALLGADDLDGAEAPLRRAVALRPDDAEGVALRGLLRISREDGDARAELERALDLQPHQADALFGLGLLAHQRRELAAAERYLKQAMEARPGDRSTQVVLALVLSDLRRCEEAIPLYTSALAADYRNMTLHAGLVRCYEMTGRMGEAEQARRVAEEILGQTQ